MDADCHHRVWISSLFYMFAIESHTENLNGADAYHKKLNCGEADFEFRPKA